MNIRKSSIYLESLTLIYVIYALNTNHADSEVKSILAICLFIVFEIILFSIEYYTLIKTKKAFIIETRKTFLSFESLFNILLMILFFAVLIYNHYKYDNSGFNELILTTLVSLKGLFFRKQKDSILVTSEIIFLNRLLEQDIFLNEIKDILIISEKNNIEISTIDLKLITIQVNEKYFIDNKSKLERFCNIL